jgi:hypothetical protein
MKVDLKNIDYYYLTQNNEKRKNHMINEFKNYNLFEINPKPQFNGDRCKSASSGFLKMLEVASNKMKNNFKPFVMLEDDVKKKDNYPDLLEIPDNCDLFYLCHQKYGVNGQTLISPIFITQNENIVKLINMISNTAIAVCSIKGLLHMQKCMMTVFYEKQPWDIPLAHSMHTLNVYSTTHELIYQYEPVANRISQINTLNLPYLKNRSADSIPNFMFHNIKKFPLLISNNLKKIKIFAAWTDCNTIFNKVMNEYDWKSDSKYNVDYIFTTQDDFTHAILMNLAMPNLLINKKNVIGLAQEPANHFHFHNRGSSDKFMKYCANNVSKYYLGSTKSIKESKKAIDALCLLRKESSNKGIYFRIKSSSSVYWSKNSINISKDIHFKSEAEYKKHRREHNLPQDWSNIKIISDEKTIEKCDLNNNDIEEISLEPFVEKISYQLPHISYKIVNNFIKQYPEKNKIINYVYSWKNPGYPSHLYHYRHELGNHIFKNNLPIDIYGSVTNSLKKNYPNKKNIKDGFDWKDVDKIYKPYKFSVVIENVREPEYISEKIMIPLLCGSNPIYLGSTNIDNYFKDYVIHLSGNIEKDIHTIKNIIDNPDKYYKKINIKEIKEKIHLKNIIHQQFL